MAFDARCSGKSKSLERWALKHMNANLLKVTVSPRTFSSGASALVWLAVQMHKQACKSIATNAACLRATATHYTHELVASSLRPLPVCAPAQIGQSRLMSDHKKLETLF